MLKTLGFLPRRRDLDRAAFRAYYERRHAPLALEHIRVFARYVRNHVVESSPAELPFDTVSEFWFDDTSAAEAVGKWLASPAGAVLRDDEAQFMDRPRIAACAVEERLLLGPARVFEPGPTRKLGVLLLGGDAAAAHELRDRCVELAKRLASRLERAALDLALSPPPAHLPVRGVLWLWPRDTIAFEEIAVAGPCDVSILRMALDAIETDPARLRDRTSSAQSP